MNIEENLGIFARYYQQLNQLESGGEEKIMAILDQVDIGEISEEHK